MKKLFIIIVFMSLVNCEKDLSSYKEKFFDPQKLPLLSLEDVGNFWHDDSVKDTSNYMGAYFEDHSGFLDGVDYSGDKKRIGVSVFKSQVSAIEAMELRISNVAAIIESGVPNEVLKGKWWFGDGISKAVFANQWNTIIEVSYYHPDYEEVKTLLMETVAEIASRINALSN